MADVVGCLAELAADAVHRIAVDSVGADGLHVTRGRDAQRHVLRSRAHVPWHNREEHANVPAVEIGDHLAQPRQAAGHVVQQVMLIAIVDADVRIDRPDEHGINAAIAGLQVVEIAIDRVFARHGVVEVPLFDHNLGLDEATLRPGQFAPAVLGTVVTNLCPTLLPPRVHGAEPRRVVLTGGRPVDDFARYLQLDALPPCDGGKQTQ